MKLSKLLISLTAALLLCIFIHNVAISDGVRRITLRPGDKGYYCPNNGMYIAGETVDDFCGMWKSDPRLYKECVENDYKGILNEATAGKCERVIVKTHVFNTSKCYVATAPKLYPSKALSISCEGPEKSKAMERVKALYP